MRASRNRHTKTVKFLLEEGARVDLPNKVRNSCQLMEVVCIHIIVHETRTGTMGGLN